MRRGPKVVLAGVCTAMLAVSGYGVYNITHSLTASHRKPVVEPTALATEPPSDADATKLARAFLDSWAAGPSHYPGAAGDTDVPAAAQQGLADFHDGLKLSSVRFGAVTAVGPATGVTGGTHVTFTITAQVKGGAWSYPGALDVVRSSGGGTAVHWAPTVLHPKLKEDQQLVAGTLPAAADDVVVTDYHGAALTSAKYPSLGDIISQLKTRYAAKAKGSAGTGVAIVDADGDRVSTVETFTAAKPKKLRTTLDAGLQAAAERAVNSARVGDRSAGVVAIDHGNGYVKAVAYRGNDGDIAINGWSAPGSTMKIITAAALIDRAGMGPGTAAPCPTTAMVNGQIFHNVDDEHATGATLSDAFRMSCNTAFIKLVDNAWDKRPEGFTAVGDEARQVFGIGSWSIGVATKDPQLNDPAVGDRNLRAGDAIGQGDIAVSPLVMASVAATVRNTGFRQPILVPGLEQTPAQRPISAGTAQAVRQLMRATALGGTAAPRVGDLPGVGAKTGTAEVGEGRPNNGWFTAYDDRIAVAAEVIGGGTGVDSAGYVVRDVLLADR
ncbi:penicillin-binding transpeptidase domain-containing protein [Streptomyces sp. NPDC092296]|uniref:penicillin-binding transpeptidase domain-containing protein n=1 Tax=Streptomyces sp. NPDC092296 TaxID=3366012 RepID=UPI003821B674